MSIPPAANIPAWAAASASASTTATAAMPTAAMADLTLAPPAPPPQRAKLTIPLDEPHAPPPPRRQSSNRASLRRRNALLIGSEGSRRRQRYENSRLLSNPFMTPPEPADYLVRPTWVVRSVPYGVAGLWEETVAPRVRAREAHKEKEEGNKAGAARQVRRELRARVKGRSGAKGWLKELEETVRSFVVAVAERVGQGDNGGRRTRAESGSGGFVHVAADATNSSSESVDSSSDEEIVFVGRRRGNAPQRHHGEHATRSPRVKEKLVFDALADDQGARFGYVLSFFSLRVGTHAHTHAHAAEGNVGLTCTDAGWCTPSHSTTISAPGPSPPTTTPRIAKPTSASSRRQRARVPAVVQRPGTRARSYLSRCGV